MLGFFFPQSLMNVLSFPAFVVLVVFLFVFLANHQKAKAAERRDKLRILEEAIRNNTLDPATRDDLYEILTGRRPGQRSDPNSVGFLGKTMFAFGWMGMFVGAAMLFGADTDEISNVGLGLGIGSLGVLTVPLAMRELQGQRRTT